MNTEQRVCFPAYRDPRNSGEGEHTLINTVCTYRLRFEPAISDRTKLRQSAGGGLRRPFRRPFLRLLDCYNV